MIKLAPNYKCLIQDAGGVHSYVVAGIIRKLNRLPMGASELDFPTRLKAICHID